MTEIRPKWAAAAGVLAITLVLGAAPVAAQQQPMGAQEQGARGPDAGLEGRDRMDQGRERSDAHERWSRRDADDRDGRQDRGWFDDEDQGNRRQDWGRESRDRDHGRFNRRDDWNERRTERGATEHDRGGSERERPPAGAMMGPAGMARFCGPDGERIGARMLAGLERITRPTENQREAFENLKQAAAKAMETVRSACSTERPITPPGRLAAAEKRLQAMLDAVKIVRPAMDAFYATLTEEQKARLYAASAMRHGGMGMHQRMHERGYGRGGDEGRGGSERRRDEERSQRGDRDDRYGAQGREQDRRGGFDEDRGDRGRRLDQRRDDDRDSGPNDWRGRL